MEHLLDKRIIALLREKGWEDLTDIQKLAIPRILNGENVLITAPTGYGKTEAALLPIFHMMLRTDCKPVAVLYITPLRALINDLTMRISWWAERLGFTTARKHGDVPQHEKAQRLRRVPHIMVLTPESLEIDLDWASKFREYYKNVRWVIVDEVHELVGTKRGAQLAVLLERLKELTGNDFQRIGLSATIGSPEVAARFLFGSSSRPRAIVSTQSSKHFEITVEYIDDRDDNDVWLEAAKVVANHIEPPTLVFVNSRFTAERLHEALERIGVDDVFVHHSSVSRDLRHHAEAKLRNGELRAIVCTKTLELGIDIGDVRKVVLFRPPGTVSSTLQRIGRSGHKVDDSSRGVLVAVGPLDALESLATARLACKGTLEKTKVLNAPLDVAAKEIMGMCMQYGAIEPDKAYKILKASYPFSNLDKKTFDELISYMIKTGLLVDLGGKVKLGPTFYKIWRFETSSDKKWWTRSFTEFFSTIAERDSFIVKYGGKVIGDIDAAYVYKHLRVGDVVRLSGKRWRIVDIDDTTMKIEVVPASTEEGEVPLWRGEGARRTRELALEVVGIIKETWKHGKPLTPPNVYVDDGVIHALRGIVEEYASNLIPLPSEDVVIVERCGDETFFIHPMGQNVAETLAHTLMYLISSKHTLNVAVRTSFLGFSVKVRGLDPLALLLSLNPSDLLKIANEAIKRSPLLYSTLRELQLSLGKTSRPDPYDDYILYQEAAKQVLEEYFDIDGAVEFVEKLKSGELKVHEVVIGKLSPLARMIARLPSEKPWVRDLSLALIKVLEGMAFTVDELAEILNVPAKTIENKLKELRKPDVQDRVFQFIDVELHEWRWALVRDAEVIRCSEEFASSFTPPDEDEAFLLMLKPRAGESYYTIYFTPKEVLNSVEDFKKKIPLDEVYEVKVVSLADSLLRSLSPKYYYVPRDAIPYIALNGATLLQKLKQTA